MARGQCVFCKGGPLTREHGWPEWIDKFLVPRSVRRTAIADGHILSSRGEGTTVSGSEVRVVCKPCNTRWMSQLEDATKPILGRMIQGCGTNLDESAQQTLAAWLVKTYLVHAAHNPKRETLGLDPLYEYFHKHRLPTPTHCILIGAICGGPWITTSSFQPLVGKRKREPGANPIKLHLATLVIGHFIGQVWFMDYSQGQIKILSGSNSSMKVIWPYETTFIWPPGPFLSQELLQGLAQQSQLPQDPNEVQERGGHVSNPSPWPEL